MKPFKNNYFLLFLAGSFTNPSQAEKIDTSNQYLEHVIVTATRSERNILDIPNSVEVIDKEKIDATAGYFITDILKKNASVDVIEYPGGLSGVGIRGFRPQFSGINQRVLVLLNGRPAGATSMGTIASAGIDRVEVVKGSASAIYGPSAMGGVVNYITRQSTGELSGNLTAGYGSFDTHIVGGNIGGSLSDNWDFDLGLSHRTQSSDYQLGKGGDTFNSFEQGHGKKRPNTSYQQTNFFFRTAYDFSPDWQIQLRLFGYDAPKTETPGAESYGTASQDLKNEQNYGGDFGITGQLGDHQITALYYQTYEDYKNTEQPLDIPDYINSTRDTNFSGFQLQDTWQLQDNYELIYGADYSFVETQSSSFNNDGSAKAPYYPYAEQTRYGGFADLTATWFDGRVIANVGMRYDHIKNDVLETPLRDDLTSGSEHFDTTNPRAGILLRPKPDSPFRLHASVGTGYIVPEANQLAGLSEKVVGEQVRITEGNAELAPESSKSYDLGIGYDTQIISLDLTYFRLDTQDRITTVITTNTDTQRYTTYENALSSLATGWELSAYWDMSALLGTSSGTWTTDLSSTYYDKRDEEIASGTRVMPNVARLKVNLGITYKAELFDVRIGLRHVEGMKDNDYSQERVFTQGTGGIFLYPDFTIADISAGWDIDSANRVTLKVDNLTDKYYYEKADYPMPGRAISANYNYSF